MSPRPRRRNLRRSRPSGAVRLTRTLALVLSCGVLVTSGGGWVAYTYLNGRVKHVSLGITGPRPAEAPPGTENYLLVGTDSRAGTGNEYGGSAAPGQRSDSTILAHLDKDGSTTMVSFPRDTWVTIPEYQDANKVTHPAHKGKFNEAISDAGAGLLVKTVESLTGVHVDHYVSIDLAGFKAMTDAVGGVQVCINPSSYVNTFRDDNGARRVSTNTNDPISGFRGVDGTNTLNGEMALAFVRQRHGLPNSDLDRIKRQQQFLGAVFRKATGNDVLTNPLKLERLLTSASSALTLADTQLSDLKLLASRLRGLSAGTIRFETLPTHAPTRAEGAIDDLGDIEVGGRPLSVQFYRQGDLDATFGPLRATKSGGTTGGTPAAGTGTTGGSAAPTAAVRPAQVRVAVYNGTRTAGLASRAVTALDGVGFAATNAGNAAVRGYADSRVLYGPGSEAAARLVQSAVPSSRLVADSSVTGVQLIVGSTYTGVQTPSTTGTTPRPNVPATPEVPATPPRTAAGGTGACTF